MIGVDTNVLLRWIVDDAASAAEQQAARAAVFGQTVFISSIVLAEFLWLLRSIYRRPKAEILSLVARLLEEDRVRFEDDDLLRAAFADQKAKRGDLIDCLIARHGECAGCSATLTFDKKASRHPGFKVLKVKKGR